MLHEPQNNARHEKNGQDDDFWVGIPEAADMIPGSVPIGIEDTATTLSLLNNGTTRFEANDPLTPAMLPVTPGSATAGTQDAGDGDTAGSDTDAVGADAGEDGADRYGDGADRYGDGIDGDGDGTYSNEAGDPGPDETDPLGSWTGTPADEDEVPTQDADDL